MFSKAFQESSLFFFEESSLKTFLKSTWFWAVSQCSASSQSERHYFYVDRTG